MSIDQHVIDEGVPLNLVHKDTFFDACRLLRPRITRDEFEAMWEDFLRLRDLRELRGLLQ